MLPRQFLPTFVKIGTPAFRRFVFELLPFDSTRTLTRIVDIMDATSRQVFQGKKDALAKGDEAVKNQIGRGKDIMSVLSEQFDKVRCFSETDLDRIVRANMDAKSEDKLPEEEILGQMRSLYFPCIRTT